MKNYINKLKMRAMDKQMQEYYARSPRFRAYVDRCAAQARVSAKEILRHALSREVAKMYQAAETEEAKIFQSGSTTYAPVGECV